MDHVYWIDEGRLAGRCGPSVAPVDPRAFREAGFGTVLSLDAREYAYWPRPLPGLDHVLIHLTDSIPPRPTDRMIYAQRLPEAVEFVLRRTGEDRGAVLVHCHAGCDRTGGVLAGYLCRTRGCTPEEALEAVRRVNPCAVSAAGYEEMILEILERRLPRPPPAGG